MDCSKFKVKPGKELNLSKTDTRPGKKYRDKQELKEVMASDVEKISELQYRLYAENRQSLLIILQGMDSSGKDGTIRRIMSGVNPQGVDVHSFKHPSVTELEHDFLWRHAQKLPEHGQIVIFNRSHYENVLISRVHPEIVLAERLPDIDNTDKITGKFWKKRFGQILNFEDNLVQNGTHILKFYLHISREEQCRRFLDRIDDREKHWKFSSGDITERRFWPEYTYAYEQALIHTSTDAAPWYVVPADDKSFAHMLIARVIMEKLQKMDPSFPPIDQEEKELMMEAREELLAQQNDR